MKTFKEAGYKYVEYLGNGEHLLYSINDGGVYEVWDSNKNHASFGLIYKNTHLEFLHSYFNV